MLVSSGEKPELALHAPLARKTERHTRGQRFERFERVKLGEKILIQEEEKRGQVGKKDTQDRQVDQQE